MPSQRLLVSRLATQCRCRSFLMLCAGVLNLLFLTAIHTVHLPTHSTYPPTPTRHASLDLGRLMKNKGCLKGCRAAPRAAAELTLALAAASALVWLTWPQSAPVWPSPCPRRCPYNSMLFVLPSTWTPEAGIGRVPDGIALRASASSLKQELDKLVGVRSAAECYRGCEQNKKCAAFRLEHTIASCYLLGEGYTVNSMSAGIQRYPRYVANQTSGVVRAPPAHSANIHFWGVDINRSHILGRKQGKAIVRVAKQHGSSPNITKRVRFTPAKSPLQPKSRIHSIKKPSAHDPPTSTLSAQETRKKHKPDKQQQKRRRNSIKKRNTANTGVEHDPPTKPNEQHRTHTPNDDKLPQRHAPHRCYVPISPTPLHASLTFSNMCRSSDPTVMQRQQPERESCLATCSAISNRSLACTSAAETWPTSCKLLNVADCSRYYEFRSVQDDSGTYVSFLRLCRVKMLSSGRAQCFAGMEHSSPCHSTEAKPLVVLAQGWRRCTCYSSIGLHSSPEAMR